MKTPMRFFALALAPAMSAAAAELRFTVEAGGHPRIQTVVQVPDPGTLPERPALEATDGERLPIQLADDGTFAFILPQLDRGETKEFKVVSLAEESADRVLTAVEGDLVNLTLGGAPVATYRGGKGDLPREDIDAVYRRGGYLHPLMTPSGEAVTDDYPSNHVHHHGIWMAWTKTRYQGRNPDFWNMAGKTGTVEAVALDHSWSGPVHAGLDARHRHIDLTSGEPVPVLDELWSVRLWAIEDSASPYRLLELRSEQRMASEAELELPEYHYGGLGIRGNGAWDGQDRARFLTSEGVTDRNLANSKPARWIFMGGGIGQKDAGVAILSHPENFRSPQPVRVHPKEPFVCFAPQVGGDMEIKHATAYLSNYRFVVFDGAANADLLERLWNDYAHPPSITWLE